MSPDLVSTYRFHKRAYLNRFAARLNPSALNSGLVSQMALAKAREDIAQGKSRYCSAIYTSGIASPYRREPGAALFIESVSDIGARFMAYSDDIWRGLNHAGWYADTFQDLIYRGAVLQIPGRKGHMRFIAAYEESCNGGYVLDLSRKAVFSDLADSCLTPADSDAARDCASVANSFAESAAEKARDYDTAWQAGVQWFELGQEIREIRKEALSLIRDAKRKCDALQKDSPLWRAVRDTLDGFLGAIRDARSQRQTLAGGDHSEFGFYPSADLRAAFNDGAQETVLR
jgi:hypothetical protein